MNFRAFLESQDDWMIRVTIDNGPHVFACSTAVLATIVNDCEPGQRLDLVLKDNTGTERGRALLIRQAHTVVESTATRACVGVSSVCMEILKEASNGEVGND